MADPQQSTHDRALPQRGRASLRLVRAPEESLGPISPELVLVSPDLAAAVRSTPDALVVDASGPASGMPPLPASGRPGGSDGAGVRGAVRYDSRDLLLERHGLTLELATDGTGRLWRLTLARGETVEEPAEDDGVPGRIASLLATLVDGRELRRVPVRSENAEIQRLEERIAAQLRSLLAHDAGTRLASDPENLHQLRVASRRVRAFLRVARELVDADWAGEINGSLRELGRASGPARDLDVLIDHLHGQIRSLDDRDREAAAELIAALERDRNYLQNELLAALDGEQYRRLLDQLGLPVQAAVTPAARTLEQLAARELRKLIVQVRRLGKAPPDEQLHALRLRVKRVRYAAELGGLPGGARTARVIRAAMKLQDVLGEHQDAVVAEERIRAQAYLIGSPQVAFVAGRLAERQRRRRDDLQQRLPSAWRQLRRLARRA